MVCEIPIAFVISKPKVSKQVATFHSISNAVGLGSSGRAAGLRSGHARAPA